MKKIILLALTVFMLSGCGKNIDENKGTRYIQDEGAMYYTIIDKETCIEYIRFSCGNQAGLSARYNADGTIKLNEECLNETNNFTN